MSDLWGIAEVLLGVAVGIWIAVAKKRSGFRL